MKRTLRVMTGTLAGILQIIVAIALQIVLMPLVLRVAGQETVGVYAILLQIIGYLALLDLGIGTALNRSLSQTTHDPERFQSLLNAGFMFMSIIGVAYAITGIGIGLGLPLLFHLSASIARDSQIAMFLLAFWGIVRFPLGMYGVALVAIQDLTFFPLASTLSNALRMAIAVFAVLEGQGVIGLSLASIVTEVLLMIALLWRFSYLRPGSRLQFRKRDWTVLREQFGFGMRAFWGNVAGRVIFASDNIIVGNLYGAAVTSIYYNTQTPIFVAYNLVFRLADNASPGINELWATKAWDKLRDIFFRLQRLTLLMVAPIIIGGWFYLRVTISIWVGQAQFAGQAMTLWLILFALLTTVRYVPQVFVYASGDIHRLSQLFVVEAIVNITLSFLLGAILGPHGVALASLVAHIPTVIYLQTRAHHDMYILMREWFAQTIMPALFAAIPTVLVAFVLSSQFSPTHWLELGIHALILGGVHLASCYIWGLSAPDKSAVRQLLP